MPIPNSQTHRFTYPQTFSTQHHHSYTTNPTNIWSAHFQLHQTPKILRNITVIPHQPKTRDTLKRTYTHPPSTNYPSSKRRLLLSTPHAAVHQQHHTSTQPTNRDHADIAHQTTTIISAPQSSYIYKQYKRTLTCHANDNQPSQHQNHTHQCNKKNNIPPTNHKIDVTKHMHQNPNTLPPPLLKWSPYHIPSHNYSANKSTPSSQTSWCITAIHQ